MRTIISSWILITILGIPGNLKAQQDIRALAARSAEYRPLIDRYCITCHSEKLKTAGLILENIDLDKIKERPEVWEKVIWKLRTNAMPPAGLPRPDKSTYNSFATHLETILDASAAANPNPGRPGVHRLNRAEYANAIRDLFDLEIDVEKLLPADDSGYGFDNIGDVLSVSPMLLERYMSVARQISRLALGDTTIPSETVTYDSSKAKMQDERMSEELPFGSRGGISVAHNFSADGEYLLKIRLTKSGSGNAGYSIFGLGQRHQLDVLLDGQAIKSFAIGGNEGTPILPQAMQDQLEDGLEVRFTSKAGRRVVGATFKDQSVAAEGIYRPPIMQLHQHGWGTKRDSQRDPGVESIAISGPFNVKGSGDTPSRRRIFVCYPLTEKDQDDCAKQIIALLTRRAYRHSISDSDANSLLELFRANKDRGFESAIGLVLQGILISRQFLFRVERDPKDVPANTVYRINDYELASRLAFFLWSSIPDEQLLDLAENSKLRDPEVLQEQVRRMLRDARSRSLTENFAGQWLLFRRLRTSLPSASEFPEFDENLREAFQTESELFFDSIVKEDRSIFDLLTGSYTFVNERLARHYGIPDIHGSRFRRVVLSDAARWGILGKGSLLTVTSYPDRTSPVLRGKWVLENIVGTPPPPPPPNVPPLKENTDSQRLTMRQRMEQHRANPACASCHARMDPLGFALENFDAIGKWRSIETISRWTDWENTLTTHPIDASGILPDGTHFSGPVELRKALMTDRDHFANTVVEKLLTYALGRGVEVYDRPVIRHIIKTAAGDEYRFSALVVGIVQSIPFQMRMSSRQETAVTVQ